MAPDPAQPAPGGGGDYTGWTWAQIQAAILAGVPQTLHDAGTAFDDTRLNLDDLAGKSRTGTDDLTGPGGPWQGPASVTFTGVMNELIDNVKNHVVSLQPYKQALDDAGDALADAQTDVRNAMADAGQDTINRYNDGIKDYNTAIDAYNAGTGPYPVDPGPAPYVDDGAGGQTVDVARYPEIEAALNEKMRGIITTLAGKYQTSQGQATEPDQAPPPEPQDVPPPVDDATGLPAPDAAAPPPPEEIAPVAPGTGNLSLVTTPGGLADLPPNARGAPDLARLDSAAAVPSPLVADLANVPGARFDGVLGDRPLVGNDLVAPPASPSGTIGGVDAPLLGAAPVAFATFSGLTPPASTGPVRQNLTGPGANRSGLFEPGERLSGLPPSGTLGREAGTGGIPPVPGMAGGYGMVSAGPEIEGGMFMDDVFAEKEELGRTRERSLVAGPEEGVPLIADPYAPVEEEKERENEYPTTGDDMWGTTSSASHPGY